MAAPNSGGMQAVSIRALTRRATQSKIVQVVCVLFQFVPSRGGQHIPWKLLCQTESFNSCPHAEGNFQRFIYGKHSLKFQFVPSRGGQPRTPGTAGRTTTVSIRALTRRATSTTVRAAAFLCFNSCPHAEGNLGHFNGRGGLVVSIRALTRRATSAKIFGEGCSCFNSCPHAEGNGWHSANGFSSSCFNSCPHAEGNSGMPESSR